MDHLIPAADTTAFEPVFALDTAACYDFRFEIVAAPPVTVAHEEAPPQWLAGLEPHYAATRPDGYIAVLAVLLAVILFSFRSVCRAIQFNLDELVNIRRGRDNVFDERPAALSAVQLMLTALFVACGGFLLLQAVGGLVSMATITVACGIVLSYYVVERVAYEAVGYTFTTSVGRREWIRGFSASVSLLAIGLTLPALAGLFYPGAAETVTFVGLAMFVIAKIMFITKGFRIFFNNLFSLLYFILYLCTLEIIPIILVYKCSVDLLTNA